MRDVAREADVSLATVSYILNDNAQARRITGETKKRVLSAVEQLGYKIHPIGRALQQGQTNQVILLIVTWDLALSHSMTAMAISRAAIARGCELTVHVADTDALANDFLQRQMMHHIGGLLVLWDSPAMHESTVGELVDEGIPVVDLLPGGPDNICSATADREDAFLRGTEHLLGLGHRRIGILCDTDARAKTSLRKLAGYRRGLEQAGVKTAQDWVQNVDQFGFEGGYNGFKKLVRRCPDVTAVLSINDGIALGAIAAAQEMGQSCPRDVSVVGFGDAAEGRYFQPKLTTFGLSAQRVADAAVDLLKQAGSRLGPEARKVLVKEDLIIRESSGPVCPERS